MLSREACLVVLRHIAAGEFSSQQGRSFRDIEAQLTPGIRFDSDEVGADSLQILSAASAVNTLFRLHEAGSEDYLLRHKTVEGWADVVEASWKGGFEGITFLTGGTTGAPRQVIQPWAHLMAEIRRLGELAAGSQRILALVPLNHIYGFLWGAALSDHLGAALVTGNAADRAIATSLRHGDLIVAVPDQWRYILSAISRFPQGVTGVTSTAPADPAVIAGLKDAGLGRMLEIYGSSETGAIGWRDTVGGPYELMSQWVRVGDYQIKDQTGRIMDLPDNAEWDAEGRLTPTGRRDGAVQIGGTNVWPGKVRDRLASHPAVSECAVRPMDMRGGKRLKAFVVLRDEGGADRSTEDAERLIRKWVQETFSTAERPVHLTFGQALPRNHISKLCDWPIDEPPVPGL